LPTFRYLLNRRSSIRDFFQIVDNSRMAGGGRVQRY
jgi:hypothetical protein